MFRKRFVNFTLLFIEFELEVAPLFTIVINSSRQSETIFRSAAGLKSRNWSQLAKVRTLQSTMIYKIAIYNVLGRLVISIAKK